MAADNKEFRKPRQAVIEKAFASGKPPKVVKPVVPVTVAPSARAPVLAAEAAVMAKPVKPLAVARPVVPAKPVAATKPIPPVAALPKPPVAAPAANAAVAIPPAPPAPIVAPAPFVPAPPATAAAAPVAPITTPEPTIQPKKEVSMNEQITDYGSKATLEQVAAKSKEAMEQGMKSLDEMSATAKDNVEALLASTKAATSGLEAIAREVADFSRKSFEETTAAARAMTTVKTPNELIQLQNDFAKTQFDSAVAEMSKLSETMLKLAGEIFEPMQNRIAVTTDKLKTAASTAFNR